MAYEIQDENKSDAPTYNPVELFGEQVLDGVADLFNKMADEVEPHDAADLGDLYRFMVATTPYPVYVRAADSRAAPSHRLRTVRGMSPMRPVNT